MDVTLRIEQPDHSFRTYEKKDLPIIIENNIPQAMTEVWSLVEPVGVATVEATEKGGQKEASHSYK